MKKPIVLFFLVSINAACLYSMDTVFLKKWETFDLAVRLDRHSTEEPYDLDLNYLFISPSGKELKVAGFYNGSREWIFRFTPNEAGSWSAKPLYINAELTHLIHVSDPGEGQHGGLVINPDNPQKLYYEDGTAYNMLAFELDWLFALDYGDSSLPKARQLIKSVKENGFNKVVMNVYAFDRKEKPGDLLPKHDYGSMLNIFPFAGNNENPDFSSLNIAFFKHLDNIIELLNEEGIIAHLMIYVWNKKVNWPKPGSKEDNMYFDYIVKRYQAYPNIFWDISKEALSYGRDDMAYISDRIDRLRKLDVYDRLLTVHDHKYCVNYPDKIDVFSTQDWGTDLYNRMLTIGNDFNTKPIFNIEHGGYEQCQYDVFIGNYVDPEVCLRRNYECLFAGVYSTYYWQCTSWNVIIHDPLVSAEPKPKFHYYLHMRNFMDTHHFELLNPVSHVSASGFALHNPGTGEYFYYVPVENTAIDVKNLPVAKDVEIRWFNTISGEYSTPFHQEWSDYFRLVKHFQEASILIVKLIDKYAIIR